MCSSGFDSEKICLIPDHRLRLGHGKSHGLRGKIMDSPGLSAFLYTLSVFALLGLIALLTYVGGLIGGDIGTIAGFLLGLFFIIWASSWAII
jgi:hypothetical protein